MMSVWDVWVGVSYMNTQQRNLNLFDPQKDPRYFKLWREMRMTQKQHLKKTLYNVSIYLNWHGNVLKGESCNLMNIIKD